MLKMANLVKKGPTSATSKSDRAKLLLADLKMCRIDVVTYLEEMTKMGYTRYNISYLADAETWPTIRLVYDMSSDYYDKDKVLDSDNYHFEFFDGKYLTNDDGVIYVGLPNNPHYILAKVMVNNKNLILHQDTRLVYHYAFSDFKEVTYNDLVIGSGFMGTTEFIHCYLKDNRPTFKVKRIFIYSDNYGFIRCQRYADRVLDNHFIFAPYVDLNKVHSEAKPKFVNGYLEERADFMLPQAAQDKYYRYLKNHSVELAKKALEMPTTFDYLIKSKLIKKEDLYELIVYFKDNEKIIKVFKDYASSNFKNYDYMNREFKEVEESSFTGVVESDYTPPLAKPKKLREHKKVNNKNFIVDLRHVVDLPRDDRYRYETFIRSTLKKGDLFVGRYRQEIIVLKYSTVDHEYLKFEMVSLDKFDNDFKLISMGSQLQPSTPISFNLKGKGRNIDEIDSIFLKTLILNDMYYGKDVYLNGELGLFKYHLIDGKIGEIKYLDNRQDFLVDRSILSFFEPYVYIEVPEELIDRSSNPLNDDLEHIVFRKAQSTDALQMVIDSFRLRNDLLLDILDMKAATMYPYHKIRNVNVPYVNSSNKTYLLKDVLMFMQEYIGSYAGNATRANVIAMFSDFYQPDTNYQGFSTDEIIELANKYFSFDIVRGEYLACDTLVDCGDELVLYDEKFLRLIFDLYKKAKGKISRCSDLECNKKDFKYFRRFNIPDNHMAYFKTWMDSVDSFKKFIDSFVEILLKDSFRLLPTKEEISYEEEVDSNEGYRK